jgi:hypothetical protein
MRENIDKIRRMALYVPLAFVCIAIFYLGTVFLQGYDSGNALPHIGGTVRFAGSPSQEPEVEAIEIADTSDLPTTMPAVPTPAKQVVMHAMQRREQAPAQAARPLPSTASSVAHEVANPDPSAGGNVLGSSDNNGDKLTDPTPPALSTDPVPEIPEPQIPPIRE